METKTTPNQNNGQKNDEPKPKKSWFERNLWLIALFIAMYMLRMCNVLLQ